MSETEKDIQYPTYVKAQPIWEKYWSQQLKSMQATKKEIWHGPMTKVLLPKEN